MKVIITGGHGYWLTTDDDQFRAKITTRVGLSGISVDES